VKWALFYRFILHKSALGVSMDDAREVMSGLQQAEKLYPAERWRLCWLAVSPKCQRTGIGKRLVQWGLDRCEEEGTPAVLESSIPGKPLYEKMGFREIGCANYNKGRHSQPVMLRPVVATK
jgi:ribosomal protein S18 acetylase RimI-like enzyme